MDKAVPLLSILLFSRNDSKMYEQLMADFRFRWALSVG